MYTRNRYSNNNFFQVFFWMLVGFMIGQIIRLDVGIAPRTSTSQPTQNAVYLEL